MKTIACIATVKGREKLLEKTVKSLAGQVDEVFIVFRNEPRITLPNNATYVILDNEKGDAAKFWLYCKNPGLADVWFFCDDDLLYPPDYVERSLKNLKKYPNAVLSYHGRRIKNRPIDSYYRFSRLESFRCTMRVSGYNEIGVNGTCGTGVMFFASGSIKLNLDDFKQPNMADIWLAKFAIESGVKMVVCPHEIGWLTDLDPMDEVKPGIFRTYQFNDEIQTMVYNSIVPIKRIKPDGCKNKSEICLFIKGGILGEGCDKCK